MCSIPRYSSQQPCEVGWVSYNFLRNKATEAQRWLMIYVEVVDISYSRDKVNNNFKGYETQFFFISRDFWLVTFINYSKTLVIIYLIVFSSYKVDFKESPLKAKLDSVLWYLRDIWNVKTNYAFSLCFPKNVLVLIKMLLLITYNLTCFKLV